jgi:hypothetical protein
MMINQNEKRLAVSFLDSQKESELSRIYPTEKREGLPYPPKNYFISMN